MNAVHANLINQSNELMANILSKSKDSIETNLCRTSARILGFVVALPFGGIPGVFMFDSDTDGFKLRDINAHLINLKQAELDKASPDYEKAIAASDFQFQVYKNVAKYTKTAKKVKDLATVGAFLCFIGSIGLMVLSQECSIPIPSLQFGASIAARAGLLVFLPAATYRFYHWMSAGNELEGANRALAEQRLGQRS